MARDAISVSLETIIQWGGGGVFLQNDTGQKSKVKRKLTITLVVYSRITCTM